MSIISAYAAIILLFHYLEIPFARTEFRYNSSGDAILPKIALAAAIAGEAR